MDINGKTDFKLPRETIWDALHDPEILKQVIPGCQKLELIGDNEYEVVMKLGIAAVKGEYTGKVKLDDIDKPAFYVFNAEGSGSPGHVKAKMDCRLTDTEKGCLLEWDCKAEVGGMIASVGSRVLNGIAKFMAGKFFKDIEKKSREYLTTK